MGTTERLREQIDRSTQRLAQLRARELLSEQRNATRIREANRRAEARRKTELGALVIASGAGDLEDTEIVGALLAYRQDVSDPAHREHHKREGAAHLADREPACNRARMH